MNLVVNCHPGTSVVWYVSAMEIVTMALVRSRFAARHSVARFSFYGLHMSYGGCMLLIRLEAGVCGRVDYHDIPSFVLGCAFDLVLAYLLCRFQSKKTGFSWVHFFVDFATALETV